MYRQYTIFFSYLCKINHFIWILQILFLFLQYQNTKHGFKYSHNMNSISIIIPVYNVEKYIRHCIESVMTQDTAGADVECIVVNDCTPDGSMAIVNDMIASYHGSIHFVVLHHRENKELSAARNTGEAYAKGDFILFIPSYRFPAYEIGVFISTPASYVRLLSNYAQKFPRLALVLYLLLYLESSAKVRVPLC